MCFVVNIREDDSVQKQHLSYVKKKERLEKKKFFFDDLVIFNLAKKKNENKF